MISAQEIKNIRVGTFSIDTSLIIQSALNKGFICDFLPERAIKISHNNQSHYFKGSMLACNNTVAAFLARNKYFLRKMLKQNAIPAQKTIRLTSASQWQKVIKSTLTFPMAVKPISGSHGNGATMYITTPDELRLAVRRAFDFIKTKNTEKQVLVEEFFTGHDLRLLVVGNQVVSTLLREPAYVIGDGKNTVRKLIANFNTEWRSPIKFDLPMCPIPTDTETVRHLHYNNKTLNSIPKKNEKVTLRWNANVSTGGRAVDITNIVHPNIKKLALQVARISKLEITGVDILCKDIESADISSANVSVLEVNSAPGIDIHHFPYEGKGIDVSSLILDHIFSI
jgi:cyanophycin synthetase